MTEFIVKVEPFGEFEYKNLEKVWRCFAEKTYPANVLEISLEVEHPNQSLNKKIELMKSFVNEISVIEDGIYNFVHLHIPDKTIDKLKSTWFLSAIGLENDDQTWKVVLEPNFDVKTIDNNFLRFTLVNKEITWSSFGGEIQVTV